MMMMMMNLYNLIEIWTSIHHLKENLILNNIQILNIEYITLFKKLNLNKRNTSKILM